MLRDGVQWIQTEFFKLPSQAVLELGTSHDEREGKC